jgi:hypothetical protein
MSCSIFWCGLETFLIPNYCLPMLLLWTICDAHIVTHTYVLWIFCRCFFELADFRIDVSLISGQYVGRIHIVRVHFQYLLCHWCWFRFLDSPIFIDKSDGDVYIDEIWSHFDDFFIHFNCFFIAASIVKCIRISNVQLYALSFSNHILVPHYRLIHFISMCVSDVIQTKR